MKKVFVICLDALSPKLVERFANEGICPNFRWIMNNGGFSKVLSAIPAQTPENWTTIATGSWPGTHGIAVWGRHSYGETVMENYGDEAMSSNLCKAEYLWEAAARQGLRSVILYFVGYPPTTNASIHVDWFWRPNLYYFEICSNACYIHSTSQYAKKKEGKLLIPVELRKAEWVNTPKTYSPPLEVQIEVQPKLKGRGVTYYALLLDPDGHGYQELLLSKEKNGSKVLCSLKEGEWSRWLRETFIVEGEEKVGTVRFKLVKLSKDGKELILYRSQVYPLSGFAYPPEVGGELTEKFGPYINEAVEDAFFAGLVDEKTLVEELEYQVKWISNAAKYLMDKHDASLYMMHWHFIDYLQHRILSMADPAGGIYNPNEAEKAWHILRLGYQIADKLVGEFLKYLDEETYIVVVSDHGNSPNRKVYSILKALANRGLIELEEHEGKQYVNWTKSKIFIDLTNIYVNLKSRYKMGIVEDSEYEEIRREVIDVLRSCKDQDGEYVVAFALRREDAPVVGLWGEHVGDIVFVYSPGFTWGTQILEGEGSVRVGGANHGPQIPTTETEVSSNYATFMIVGKDVKKGYVRPINRIGPVKTVDIAPTISYILGIKPPRHSQGSILYDFFEDWDISDMKRKSKPLKFPERAPLIGDVT
jgi:predicted AlkP superfamily phosphohydrolase/phosphomutase